jgi:hypothetical protein
MCPALGDPTGETATPRGALQEMSSLAASLHLCQNTGAAFARSTADTAETIASASKAKATASPALDLATIPISVPSRWLLKNTPDQALPIWVFQGEEYRHAKVFVKELLKFFKWRREEGRDHSRPSYSAFSSTYPKEAECNNLLVDFDTLRCATRDGCTRSCSVGIEFTVEIDCQTRTAGTMGLGSHVQDGSVDINVLFR